MFESGARPHPAPSREPALARMLQRIRDENASSYKYFATLDGLRELVDNDLVPLMTEYSETARGREQVPGEVAETAPTSLPIPRNPLTGREQELAMAMLEEALESRRQLGDRHGAYATLNNLSLAASWQGHNERAICSGLGRRRCDGI